MALQDLNQLRLIIPSAGELVAFPQDGIDIGFVAILD